MYGNSINLRGIGPNATLMLVDGHRMTSNSRSVNPSVIPTLGLERVEVVADGASAIYGSDAIAGVVNLIPRRNLDGVEAFARYGLVRQMATSTRSMSGAAGGKVWDTAASHARLRACRSLTTSAAMTATSSAATRRHLAAATIASRACSPGNAAHRHASTYAIPAGGLTARAMQRSWSPAPRTAATRLIGQDLFPRQKYDSVNTTFNQDIDDWSRVFADGF